MDMMSIAFYLIVYNLILVIVPAILINKTRNFLIIFGFQVFLMAIMTPILVFYLSGG